MTKGNPDNTNKTTRKIVIDTSKRDPNELTVGEIKALPPEEQAAYLAAHSKEIEEAAKAAQELSKAALKDLLQPVFEMLQRKDFQDLIKDAEARENVLLPYIESVLNDPKNKGKYKGITAEQVLDNLDIMGRVINPEEISAEILKRAEQRKRAEAASKALQEKQEQKQAADQINYKPGNTITTTSTKIASEFFSLAPPVREIEGQLTLNTTYTTKGRNIAVLSYFSYNDDKLNANGITSREFTDFDYFVAMVCNNLFSEGNKQVSLTKLWHEMGNPKNPNPVQLQELRKSLIKGMSTQITISNREILEAYNINTDSYVDIQSPVMPNMIKTEHNKANGNIMNETVYIYELSPFILVADPLHQITTWKKDILRLYKGSRTARYWRVMRYLMQQIAWIKNDEKRANRITFKHMFEATGAKRTEDRNNTLKIVSSLLEDAFKPCGYISKYKIDYDKCCIDIECKTAPGLPDKSKGK